MTSAGVHLPRLGLAHPPQLDLPIVTARHDERQSRVEGRPVDSAVVPFEDVLDDRVLVAKEVGLAGVGALHLVFEGHRLRGGRLLSEAGDVPHANAVAAHGQTRSEDATIANTHVWSIEHDTM